MYYITISHNGLQLTLGRYVELIREVKAAPKGTKYRETLRSWAGGTREDILREFGDMVTDKINEHLQIRELTDARLLKKKEAHLRSDCRWCGSSLNRYEPLHRRFCDESCQRSHCG